MNHLGWYPPAPAPGPATLVDLPGDDWSLEPKVNGCRVLVTRAEVWTRQGTPLSAAKGRSHVRTLVQAWPWRKAGIVEGEYVAATQQLWLFDLPEQGGSYDERVLALADGIARLANPAVVAMPRWTSEFRLAYAQCRREGFEGVVLKRRASCYAKGHRPNPLTRDWLKRRFLWDR